MQTPNVGAEWSSETTTVRPLESFFMPVGAFHCWAKSGAANSSAERKMLRMDFISRSPLREKSKRSIEKENLGVYTRCMMRRGHANASGTNPYCCEGDAMAATTRASGDVFSFSSTCCCVRGWLK